MHRFFIKTPWWVKTLFPQYIWHIPVNERAVYITFDDGPHPEATPFVLAQLRQYGALATFFCIGKNVVAYPLLYQQIISEGHAVGNHTFDHLNGWKTPTDVYVNNMAKAAQHISSPLFRPPYGRIKARQARQVKTALGNSKAAIIMWDVLSADFDTSLSPETCLANVIQQVVPGSIIVFHDSKKAFANLQYALPLALETLQKRGYIFKKLEV